MDLEFNDREIVPMNRDQFGVVVTHDEAVKLLDDGYVVKSYRHRDDEEDTYFLRVRIGAHQRDKIDLPMMEIVGRADVIVGSEPWEIGGRKGIVAFAKSAIVKETS